MKFTYTGYKKLLFLLKEHGYTVVDYHDYKKEKRCVILRHDIDNDISKALKMAQIEQSFGVKSTYFVLISSNFYNVYSYENEKMLKAILACGHEIGLHFDEARYPDSYGKPEEIKEKILLETQTLSDFLGGGKQVKSVSMHRPSKDILDADLKLPGIVNSYGTEFFHEFKYLSDSRKRWREPVEEIIRAEKFEQLHILTHPFWYRENEIGIKEALSELCEQKKAECYWNLDNNFTNLSEFLMLQDIYAR